MPVNVRVAVLNGGEYDVFRREELRTELDRLPLDGDVDIDFRKTTFMDAGAVGLLLTTRHRLARRHPQAQMRLLNVPPIIAKVLQISGAAEAFEIRAK